MARQGKKSKQGATLKAKKHYAPHGRQIDSSEGIPTNAMLQIPGPVTSKRLEKKDTTKGGGRERIGKAKYRPWKRARCRCIFSPTALYRE